MLAGLAGTAQAAVISGQGTWETTLQGRDLDGNAATFEAYYDTDLDITWLADANYAKTTLFDTDGKMVWATANNWAAGLDVNGITGWRLPSTVDAGNDGCTFNPDQYNGEDCGYNITTHSEMSHLFYVTLGNVDFYDTSGNQDPNWSTSNHNTGPFKNLKSDFYWSGTSYAQDPSAAWKFAFLFGGQEDGDKAAQFNFAWPVHSGDITAVPLPAAAWLFGSGLIGLVGMRRKR
jgi:hypothetical protein